MEKRAMSELERINKTAMTSHFIMSVVMLLFCILQTLNGEKTILYLVVMTVLALSPVLGEFIFWKRDHDTAAIKHLVAIGFACFYTVAMFTTTCSMVYVFVIPMILVVTLYNDARYNVMINVGTILESILVVILGAKTGGFGYLGLEAATIQVVVMILVGILSVYTAKTSSKNMEQQIAHLTTEQNRTEETLQKTAELTRHLEEGITGIYHELEKLNEASRQTKAAMEEVSGGAQDSAMAVQNQSIQTEAIQQKVTAVDTVASSITDNMQKTLEVLENGSRNMTDLMKQVDTSVKNSEDAAAKLELLDGYMKEMNSIVEIISGITSQTSLLALNANIEAARAGEAGRGFAVVATEISGMATQTKNATVNITELIGNVSGAIEEVVAVIRQMIDGIREEKQGAQDSADSFARLQESTLSIRTNTENMMKHVAELKAANQEIVDSIQTISAISEEVSAHASETLEAEIENAQILEHISQMMSDMTAYARE